MSVERQSTDSEEFDVIAACDEVPEGRRTTRVGSKRKRSVPTRCVSEHDDVVMSAATNANGDYDTRLLPASDFINEYNDDDDLCKKNRRQEVGGLGATETETEPQPPHASKDQGHEAEAAANVESPMASSQVRRAIASLIGQIMFSFLLVSVI